MNYKINVSYKILAVFAISFLILLNKNIIVSIIISLSALFLAYLLKIDKIRKRNKTILITGLFIFLINLILNVQTDFLSRVYVSFTAFFRIYALSLTVFIFSGTTSASELISALSFLPKNIILAIIITFSIIPLVIDEAEKIKMAQTSRGLNTSFFNPLKTVIPVIIPLIHRTLRRADQLSQIIISRGFQNE
jgi:energy-coupling factor transporter transmembrane protein EcfT